MEKEKKLKLKKITIQKLDNILDNEEQKLAKGGTDVLPQGSTQVPVFCIP